MMSDLFQPVRVGQVTIPNRIVKSAMVEGLADEHGCATPKLAALYERWSEGGVGLAITGMVTVMAGYSLTPREMGLWSDAQIGPLREVARGVHRHAGKLFVQLNHAPPQVWRSTARTKGAVAPSAGVNRGNLLIDRALTESEILEIAAAFGAAARRAREAGVDGIQLHGAHGYLISRFLSPLHNRRRDGWGGSFDRRLAFLRLVYERVRGEVGDDFPVAIKLNAHDGVPHGLTVETSVRTARTLEKWGFDAIEVSAGTGDVGLGFYPNRGEIPRDLGRRFLREVVGLPRLSLPLVDPLIRRAERLVAFSEEAYFYPEARRLAEAVSLPVVAVGGIRSLGTAHQILEQSPVAMVSMARPLLRQPHLPNQWKAGKGDVANCASCNRCFVGLALGEPLRCACPDVVGSRDRARAARLAG